MAKFTMNDFRAVTVKRALQLGRTYRITVEHEGFTYPMVFEDDDNLTNSELRVKIKSVLLTMDKLEMPEPLTKTSRDILGTL